MATAVVCAVVSTADQTVRAVATATATRVFSACVARAPDPWGAVLVLRAWVQAVSPVPPRQGGCSRLVGAARTDREANPGYPPQRSRRASRVASKCAGAAL